MISISNQDARTALRVLEYVADHLNGDSIRTRNIRRQALQLKRKINNKTKRQ